MQSRHVLLLSAAVAAVGITGSAAAQTAPDSSVPITSATDPATQADENSGEVIVTAQKRAERLQDVPLAVTSLGAGQIADKQIFNTNALIKAVPSLNFQQGNNATNTTFRVRGIGTALFGLGANRRCRSWSMAWWRRGRRRLSRTSPIWSASKSCAARRGRCSARTPPPA
jgi:iron complex outermembrane receptor protein